MKRRDFLKKSLLGAAALTVVPRHVLGGPGHTAPSDQLTKGIIGVGGTGRGHYGYAGTRLVAIFGDADRNHLDAGLQLAGEKIAAHHDYRDPITIPMWTSCISPRRLTGTASCRPMPRVPARISGARSR